MKSTSALIVGLVATGGLAACATTGESHETLTVYAAASLTDAFAEIAEGFEASHSGVETTLVYGGSADLAAQITEGAPADVFASADLAQMAVVQGELGSEQATFATNNLTIAVPEGNPAEVTGLEDLADPSLTSVVCSSQVPCGASTEELATLQGLTLAPSSHENSVTDVLGKVSTGQADAGVVYVTDIARADGVEEVAIAGSDAVTNIYPIATLAEARDPDLAEAFVAYVTGEEGLAILASYGFGAP